MPWIRVPVIEPMDPRVNVYEHTPLSYYRGEYPRFIRPVGAYELRTEWKFVPPSPTEKKPA